MHGYGYPPPQLPKRRPASATLTALRVLFVALTLMSCGFLSWASLLRLATVTRKGLDWTLMAVVVALNAGMFAYIVSTPDSEEELTDAQALVFLGWLLCTVIGTITYYLYAEIRHYGPQPAIPGGPSPYAAHGVPHAPAVPPARPAPGYGYPPSPAGSVRPPAPPQGTAPVPPAPSGPQQRPSAVPPPLADPPRLATPPRLDQVRAELDELSDYLRKEGDSR
ncbi:hypothetical protein OHT61_13165 [Streptomyces sp. NBC_00178]|uniref:hypothetical protein n=1 Tax=Streptomyces sp. NBC_00178 TaxID=2975672 RepID=UPI002E2C99BB|nr:hypothetical protein [Streptomyces sp. NBC_00178]